MQLLEKLLLWNRFNPETYVEYGALIRVFRRLYARESIINFLEVCTFKNMCKMGTEESEDNKKAAFIACLEMRKIFGDTLANALILINWIFVVLIIY